MFMRKTRLDEIPQLWNILRGDMGFVGPRPERPEFMDMLNEHLPFYYLRHLIRPGLTGWAQIRYGYGATLAETKEKLEYDLYYLKHMSLGLDLFIMFETIKTIIPRPCQSPDKCRRGRPQRPANSPHAARPSPRARPAPRPRNRRRLRRFHRRD